MASWFGRKSPVRVPTDIVVPLRYWDDTTVLKSLVLYTLSRYDAAMDPEKLRSSLERLVARGGWRKLGARLRKNDQGQIEYHVPAVFTVERPAITFSNDRQDMPISQHPLASQLPKASNRPAVVGDPVQFTPLVRPPGTPSSIDDYLNQDRGQLGLHVVSFTDATLVCLYYNHTSFDLMGWGALMTAWTHELHGRGDHIQTPIGGDVEDSDDFDPMRKLGTNPTEPHVLADRQMAMTGLVGFGVRNALDVGFRAKECRIVCIPRAFVEKLHERAISELKAEAAKKGPGGQGPEPFLTHGDVLTAWWARLAVSQMIPADSERTVTIQNAASARKALSGDSDASTKPYISNLFTMLYSLIPARELISRPVSWLAQEIRNAIAEQGTRAQLEAYFALQREMPGRIMPFFGEAGMHLMTFSNWCKADLYGHDFSPARQDTSDRAPLYPSYIQTIQLPFEFPEGTLIVGQDQAGNYWLYGFRVKGLWARIEQALAGTDIVDVHPPCEAALSIPRMPRSTNEGNLIQVNANKTMRFNRQMG